MNDPKAAPKYESIGLRVLWMLVFALVWQVAQFLLGALVVVQLVYRLVYGAPNLGMMNFGGSLSQFLAQIGRFGSFTVIRSLGRSPIGRRPVHRKVRLPTVCRLHRIRRVMRNPSYEGVGVASR